MPKQSRELAFPAVLLLVVVLATTACSNLRGRRVSQPVDADMRSAVGVSYFLAKPKFSIAHRTERGGKPAIPRFDLEVAWEPDPDRRYEVGMRPGVFVSDTFELQLAADGSAAGMTSKRVDETGKAIAGLSKFAASVAEAAAANGTKAAAPVAASVSNAERPPVIASTTLPQACSELCARHADPKEDKGKCIENMVSKIKDSLAVPNVGTGCEDVAAPLETGVIAHYECLATLENAKADPSIGKELGKLRKQLGVAMASAIADGPTQDELKLVNDLKVQLAEAISMIDERSLGARKSAILSLLRSTPTLKNYSELSNEFDRLARELKGLNSLPDGPETQATEVTARIDRDIFVDERCGPITALGEKSLPDRNSKMGRIMLARARVRVGLAKAVVITAPGA